MTLDADSGQPVDPTPLTPAPKTGVASIVNIPPQISTTIVWVGIGFLGGLYVAHLLSSRSTRRVDTRD